MPGADLNITLPSTGVDSWPDWADGVITALQTIITDIEANVVTTEITETADHDFNGYAATDLKWAQFRAGNATTIPAYTIGFKNGDFFVGDGAGREIQVTQDGEIPATAANGFTGDTAYANYTSASSLYEFKDSGGNYDYVKAARFIVANGASNAATIDYGGSTSYTMTLLPSLPASQSLVSISSSGALSTGSTIQAATTFSASITLSGSADIKHPNTSATLSAGGCYIGYDSGGGASAPSVGAGVGKPLTLNTQINEWTFDPGSLVNREGNRLKSVSVYVTRGDTNTLTVTVLKMGTFSASSVYATQTNSSIGNQTVTATAGAPSALAAGEYYLVELDQPTVGGNHTVYALRFVWDRP